MRFSWRRRAYGLQARGASFVRETFSSSPSSHICRQDHCDKFLRIAGREGELADERIVSGLHELNLDHLLNRAGGLDVEQDWATSISLREQQLLTFLRVLLASPQFVFADRAWATLTSNERRQLLSMLSKASIGYICNCEADGCRDLYDTVLDCKEGGGWTWTAGGSAV